MYGSPHGGESKGLTISIQLPSTAQNLVRSGMPNPGESFDRVMKMIKQKRKKQRGGLLGPGILGGIDNAQSGR